uniref:Uncharacterized protein n=1 Tax=Caudovirales sp. ctlwr10 TaxID=2825771 RepID=A0A8S5Q4W4_9CAUD|nr:MAG TPA: hypothetical protein [Caudovirales sp. ctlwr10]
MGDRGPQPPGVPSRWQHNICSGAVAPLPLSARSAARIFFKITYFVIFSRFQNFPVHRRYNLHRDCPCSLCDGILAFA